MLLKLEDIIRPVISQTSVQFIIKRPESISEKNRIILLHVDYIYVTLGINFSTDTEITLRLF